MRMSRRRNRPSTLIHPCARASAARGRDDSGYPGEGRVTRNLLTVMPAKAGIQRPKHGRVALGCCLRESEDKDLRAPGSFQAGHLDPAKISCFAILGLRLTVEDSDTFVFTDHGQR